MKSVEEVLLEYWKYPAFRPPQKEIIEHLLSNNDTIALLPTGVGKSICYQVPALVKEGVCLVISPLLALIEDQVNGLKKRNIKVARFKRGSSEDEIVALFDQIKFGHYKFLYLSPERLQSKLIQDKISELNVNFIAIDEAHCISEWGHDFRPSYGKLIVLKDLQPSANFIALTATANDLVLADISNNLGLKRATIFKKSFYRTFLAYQVFHVENKLLRLNQIFSKIKSPGIVYVSTRRKSEEIANYLKDNGFEATFYHGGLDELTKKEAFEDWMSESKRIMVSTNAFGMGIDKENVSVVVHFDLPYSIENYIQESGRAGRNGKKAFAVLLKNEHDISVYRERQNEVIPSIQEIKMVHQKLYQYFEIGLGEKIDEFIPFDIDDFCQRYRINIQKIHFILSILRNYDILEFTENQRKKSTVEFITSSKNVIYYTQRNSDIKNFVNSLLRTYAGLYRKKVHINEFDLAKKNHTTSSQIIGYLKQLDKDKVLIYSAATKQSEIRFNVPREDNRTINRYGKEIKKYLAQKIKKGEDLLDYVQRNDICRSIQILAYFDEFTEKKCGICDVCLTEKQKGFKDVKSEIIKLLKAQRQLNSQEITNMIDAKSDVILIHLRELLMEEKIVLNAMNQYQLKRKK